MALHASARITLTRDDAHLPGCFGHGCVMLLEGVAREHSLNKAAKQLGMAYSKAWRIIKEAEAQMGTPLLVRDGARGSHLTPEGEQAVEAYTTLQSEIDELLTTRTAQLFGEVSHL